MMVRRFHFGVSNSRLTILALSSLTFGSALGACTAATPPVTAPLSTAAPTTVVWTRRADASPESWTIDANGRVLDHEVGVRIAVHGQVWQWRESPQALKTRHCARDDDPDGDGPSAIQPSTPGSGVRATVERENGSLRDVVVEPAVADGAQTVEQTVDLRATVGPLLFVRESTYEYTCGAHGSTAMSFHVWDLERRAEIWSSDASAGAPEMPLHPVEGPRDESRNPEDVAGESTLVDAPLLEGARGRAGETLRHDDEVASFGDFGEGIPLAGERGPVIASLTEIVPRYAVPDAGLTFFLQFTAPSCYACSDGAWSSYTKSVLEPLASIPSPLRAWADPPEGVRAFLRARADRDLVLGGWSSIDPE